MDYFMTEEEFEHQLQRVRRGDGVKVKRLADLAPNLKALRVRLAAIHSKGAHVLETETGRRSDTPAIGDMILDATDVLRKGPPPEVSRANGAMGGRTRSAREMPDEKAELIWKSTLYKTNAEAIRHMPGWTASAADRVFGNSGRRRPGRPRKSMKRKAK